MKNNTRLNNALTAILMILVGFAFIIWKGAILNWLMTFLGVALIVIGVVDLLHSLVVPFIVKVVFGILLIVGGWLFIEVVLYIVAAILIIYGFSQIYALIKGKAKNVLLYLEPAFNLFAGIMLMFNQGGAIAWVFIIVGVLVIIEGALLLADSLIKK